MTDGSVRTIALAPFVMPSKSAAVRLIDWIWHIRGSVELAPGQSCDDAFDRLDPLFRESGTSHDRSGDRLTFRKQNQAAQDKMSIFNGGVLQIENGAAGSVLRYDLVSRSLLLCFVAPLLFLAFAGLSIGLGTIDKPTAEEVAAEKKKAEEREKRNAARPQNPIDKFLGAPAPEKPKTEAEKKKDEAKEKAEAADESPHSPTAAYVFAAIFAVLYLAGRLLEAWLIKRLFRRRLLGK